MPDTSENQIVYPQMKNQKAALGFPIARIVAVVSYATGAVLDAAISRCFGKGAGEHTLLRQILHVSSQEILRLVIVTMHHFFL